MVNKINFAGNFFIANIAGVDSVAGDFVLDRGDLLMPAQIVTLKGFIAVKIPIANRAIYFTQKERLHASFFFFLYLLSLVGKVEHRMKTILMLLQGETSSKFTIADIAFKLASQIHCCRHHRRRRRCNLNMQRQVVRLVPIFFYLQVIWVKRHHVTLQICLIVQNSFTNWTSRWLFSWLWDLISGWRISIWNAEGFFSQWRVGIFMFKVHRFSLILFLI